MGNQIKQKPRKQRTSSATQDIGNRVTALENTYAAQHSEIMRMLSAIGDTMKEGFKVLSDDVKEQAVKQATQEEKTKINQTEIMRIDSKLNKIMGSLGAAALTVVGGVFTLVARYFIR